MKKFNRVIATAIAVLVLSSSVACTSKTETTTAAPGDSSVAAQTTVSDTTKTAASDTAPATGEPVSIKVDVQPFASPQSLPAIGELIAQFEKDNNIKVELTVSVNDDPYRIKLLQDVVAGNAADVAFIDGSWLPEFDALDALVPLDKWANDEFKSKFIDFASEGATLDGQLKAIWFSTGSAGLYYRKDLLEAAGYTAPPKTWSELSEMAKNLTVDSNNDGNVDRYGFSFPGKKEVVSTFTMYPFLWGNTGAEMTRDGKVAFGTGADKEAMLKTLTYLQSLIQDGSVSKDTPSIGFVDIESNFIGDQCAMAIMGSWQYASIKTNAGEEFANNVGIAPLPYPDENGAPVACAGGWTMAMFTKDTAKQDAAWKFMEFWSTSEVQKILTQSGQLTTLKSVYEDPDITKDTTTIDFYNILLNGKTRDAVAYQGMMDLQFQGLLQSAAMLTEDMSTAIDTAAATTIKEAEAAGVY